MEMVKVLFTGPECSGKTTLAHWAADRWHGSYVPEYARLHLQNIGQDYALDDLLFIANQQLKMEMLAERRGGYVFCDTSLLVIQIWMMDKYGVSLWDKGFDQKHLTGFDHILLCQADFPWVEDDLRENPTDRSRLFELYEDALVNYNLSYTLIGGSLEHRKNTLTSLM